MAGKMLMPMQIERMFSGALDSSSVFTTESDRLNYLSSPIAYEGQVVSSTSGEIFETSISCSSGKRVFVAFSIV